MVERNRAHGRGALEGIADYQLRETSWRVELVARADLLKPAFVAGFDGLIVRVMDNALADALVASRKPVVDTYGRLDDNPLPSIRLDDAAIGELAAEAFADRHFKNCAYCGFPSIRFSAARGRAFASDVAGVLCAPGRVFTAEVLVAIEAAGPAVVLAGRDLSGQDAWGLSLSEDGALNVFVRLVDGSLVSRVLVANAVDAAHGVALVGDLANRSVRAYVDGVLKAEIGVADCPRPIALDAVRVVVGEGVKGRIDEVRMTRAVRTPDQFARIERKGLALVIR